MSFVRRLATTLAVVVLSGTIPQPADAQSITAAGDISSPPGGPRGDRRTADLIRRWSPTAVLALGDTQYEAGELASFRSAYYRSWGAFKTRTHPAIGNHEYLSHDGAAGYFDYSARPPAHVGSGTTRSTSARGTSSPSTPAAPWCPAGMRSRVGAVGLAEGRSRLPSDPCTLAFFHAPYRASTALHGGSPELAHLWAQLVAGGVDVVLNGHNHVYERLKPMRTTGDVDLRRVPADHVPRPVGRGLQGVDGSTHDYTGQHCH